ncbi:MAG: riboflavin synthase subunit alpha [Candidatus Uhrbacteria bacterium]
MFTGIVNGLGTVVTGHAKPGLATFVVEMPSGFTDGLSTGASVAIDGVCLTAVGIERDRVTFDAMGETLRLTTIGQIVEGSRVNVERSFRAGDEIGGHVVSGHVTGMGEIVSVETPENNHVITIRVPSEWMKYILSKGFVGVDGCSLTVVDANRDASTFRVWLIPETLRLTTFGFKKAGDHVNIEIDSRTQAIVDTVTEVLRLQANDPAKLLNNPTT